ncbi:hypothetical protein [Streptomyces nojiriensis]|uniref:hypothetical protein n=1 Tax=Streptomyces nojiriensis TaxID=66374 RepID=UPI003675FB47
MSTDTRTRAHRTRARRTSPAVVDAAVDHPDRRVRGRLAEAPASLALTAAQWSRLVLGESSGARRELLLQAAVMAGRGLTREAYEERGGRHVLAGRHAPGGG